MKGFMLTGKITNQRELRKAFWEIHPQCERKKVRGFGDFQCEMIFPIATRAAWINWIARMQQDGVISAKLASRVTLG